MRFRDIICSKKVCVIVAIMYGFICIGAIFGSIIYVLSWDPSVIGESRVSSNCTIIECTFEKVIIPSAQGTISEYYQYTPEFLILRGNIKVSRVSTCDTSDSKCSMKYTHLYEVGSHHQCKFYLSNPSYLLLIDDEQDSFYKHIITIGSLLIMLGIIPCCGLCCIYHLCYSKTNRSSYQEITSS